METSNNENEEIPNLSKKEVECLTPIISQGYGRYKHHIAELDSLVEKGLIFKSQYTNIATEELYGLTPLLKKIIKIISPWFNENIKPLNN